MTGELRLLDFGWVSGLRSQTIWHAVAEQMRPGDAPALCMMSPVEPYISIGYHRSLREIDLAACARRGVPVYRRRAGGGPVWCDSNQLFFQIVAPAASSPAVLDRAWSTFMAPAVNAFRVLGIPAHLAAGNDIVAGDRKICGTGAARIGEAVVFVGNVIFAFDFQAMADCLAIPDATKLATEALMRRFLAPVGDVAGRTVAREEAAGALRTAYEDAFGPVTTGEPTAAEIEAMERLDALFASPEWIAADRAPSPPRIKIRSGVALMTLGESWISIVDGRVERAALRNGWAPDAEAGARLERALTGVPVERAALQEAVRSAGAPPAGDDLVGAIIDAARGGL